MIYKKHELSLSLNGDNIVHIARNAAGNVVFRETSEKSLKRAIDEYLKEQEYVSEQKKKSIQIEEPIVETAVLEPIENNEILNPTPAQKRVTRGPDGKFISKSQLDTDEDFKKKSFWDKLTS